MSGLIIVADPSGKRTRNPQSKPRATHTTPSKAKPESTPFKKWLRTPSKDATEGLRIIGAAIPKALKESREWRGLSDYARLEAYRSIRDYGALLQDGRNSFDGMPESYFSQTEKEITRLDKAARRFPDQSDSFQKAALELSLSLVGEFRPGSKPMIADRRRDSLIRTVAIIGGDESNRTEIFRLLEEWLQSLGSPFGKITHRSFEHAWYNEPEERNQIVRLIADYREEGTL